MRCYSAEMRRCGEDLIMTDTLTAPAARAMAVTEKLGAQMLPMGIPGTVVDAVNTLSGQNI